MNLNFPQHTPYFWSKMEIANLVLEKAINHKYKKCENNCNLLGDANNWPMFVALVKKYGAVPKSAMPETKDSQNSAQMLNNLNQRLLLGIHQIQNKKSEDVSEEDLRKLKIKILKDIYKILVFHLGFPPDTFYFTYTTKGPIDHNTAPNFGAVFFV